MARPERQQLPKIAWWEKEGDDAALALYSQGQALEMASYGRRYRHALLYRLVTGEDAPAVFGYWLSARVAPAISSLSLASYAEPSVNVIASALEVFENRIGTLRPFVQMIPKAAAFSVREACKMAEFYVDALFDYCRLYGTTRLSFRDAGTWGTAPLKVTPAGNRKAVKIERVLADEILVDDAAAIMGQPQSLIQRRYITRPDAIAEFVDTAPTKEQDALMGAIRAAPLAFTATFWGGPTPDEKIALLEGWKLPGADGTAGCNYLALPNKILTRPEEREWTRDHYPFAFLRWTPLSMGFWGGSMAMSMLPYQVTINKHVDRLEANMDRMAFSGWLVQGAQKLRAEALGGRPGRIIRAEGQLPQPIAPPSNAPDAYTELEKWIQRAYMRVGLNQQTVAGVKQPGLTAAAALRTMVQIEDARNKGLQIALEGFIKDIAELACEAAEDINLRLELPGVNGKTLSWKDLGLKANQRKISVFPVNALVNDPEGRQQQISEWYADGLIDKRARFRLQEMPDIEAYAMLATSSDDLIESQLDEIVRTGEFVAPEPFDDLGAALSAAQSRYWLEKRLKTDRKVLRQLQAYMTAIADIMQNGQQFLAPPPPAPGPGMQMPAGAPAAPPPQTAPSMAPPAMPEAA